jgi:hypothetical protein
MLWQMMEPLLHSTKAMMQRPWDGEDHATAPLMIADCSSSCQIEATSNEWDKDTGVDVQKKLEEFNIGSIGS